MALLATLDHIMTTESYNIFCHQLDFVIKKFPDLKITETSDGKKIIKGILDIKDTNKDVVGNFLIEIKFHSGFPNRFPLLYETGGDIPNEADWHKYPDGRCCITIEPDEILKCKNGITVLEFIENYCIPYFANQIYFKINHKYKNGAYSHGIYGLHEFYTEIFNSLDISSWRRDIYMFIYSKIPHQSLNDNCFCSSGKSYKNCHYNIWEKLSLLGGRQLLKDINILIK